METIYTILGIAGIIFPILYYFEYKKSTKAFNDISKLQMKYDVINAIGNVFADKLYVLREKGYIPDTFVSLFKKADDIAQKLVDLIPEIEAEEKILRGGIPVGIPDIYLRLLFEIEDLESEMKRLPVAPK